MNVSILSNMVSVGLAQTTAPSGGGGLREILTSPMGLLLILLPIFWIFVFNSRRKDDKKKKAALSQIKRGDRVQTIGGIIGKVVEVDPTRILVKVDETSNTKIWFIRNAVATVLEDEKAVVAAKVNPVARTWVSERVRDRVRETGRRGRRERRDRRGDEGLTGEAGFCRRRWRRAFPRTTERNEDERPRPGRRQPAAARDDSACVRGPAGLRAVVMSQKYSGRVTLIVLVLLAALLAIFYPSIASPWQVGLNPAVPWSKRDEPQARHRHRRRLQPAL